MKWRYTGWLAVLFLLMRGHSGNQQRPLPDVKRAVQPSQTDLRQAVAEVIADRRKSPSKRVVILGWTEEEMEALRKSPVNNFVVPK
jgi:hypothetical protein